MNHKPLTIDEVIDLQEQAASSSRKYPLEQMMRKCEQLCKQYLVLLQRQEDDYK